MTRFPVLEWLRDVVPALACRRGGRSVRLPPSPDLRSGSQACPPSEIEGLLIDVVADGFVLYCHNSTVATLRRGNTSTKESDRRV